jgi:hypothetical protein
MQVEQAGNGERGMSILLRYQGIAVEDGTMNVYDVAKNMVAFSDYVISATHQVYGDGIEVRAEVNAFQHGSFVTDLIFHVVGVGTTFLAIAPDVKSVVSAVKESLDLFVFLRGEAPARVEHRDDRSVHVTNNNGSVTQVNIESLHITLDEKAAKAAGVFVREALSKPGVSAVEITSEGHSIARASESEADFFHPITDEKTIVEQTVKMGLVIEVPSFKESNKWIMWDGDASLRFAMEDENFLSRIDNGEAFRKGDILICDVRVTQTKVSGQLKIHRAVVTVHDHKPGESQAEMEV